MSRYGISEVGTATSEQRRPIVFIRVTFFTPRLRDLLRTMPRGLVRALPDLRRIGSA